MARSAGGLEAVRQLTRHIDVLPGARLRAVRPVARQRDPNVVMGPAVSRDASRIYENGSIRVPTSRLWRFRPSARIEIAEPCQGLPWNILDAGGVGMAETSVVFDHEAGARMSKSLPGPGDACRLRGAARRRPLCKE